MWCAGDLIQYIAGFAAFMGSIVLGLVSIVQTEKANSTNDKLLDLTLESERKSVLPYLSFTYCRASRYEIALDPNCSKQVKHENVLSDTPEILFLATAEEIDVLESDNPNAIEVLKELYSFNETGYGYELPWGDGSIKRFKIVNCGKNAAVNLTCCFHKAEYEQTHYASSLPFTLPAGEYCYVYHSQTSTLMFRTVIRSIALETGRDDLINEQISADEWNEALTKELRSALYAN